MISSGAPPMKRPIPLAQAKFSDRSGHVATVSSRWSRRETFQPPRLTPLGRTFDPRGGIRAHVSHWQLVRPIRCKRIQYRAGGGGSLRWRPWPRFRAATPRGQAVPCALQTDGSVTPANYMHKLKQIHGATNGVDVQRFETLLALLTRYGDSDDVDDLLSTGAKLSGIPSAAGCAAMPGRRAHAADAGDRRIDEGGRHPPSRTECACRRQIHAPIG